jgi:hypothetical protein
MDNHRVVDVGMHDTLMESSSKYQDLIKRQSVMMRDVTSSVLDRILPGIRDGDEEEN